MCSWIWKKSSLSCPEYQFSRKRAENKRFRKKKDIDVINENDDAIAKMIADMRIAAKEDRDLNIEGKPGVNKMKMFPVGNKKLHQEFNSVIFSNAESDEQLEQGWTSIGLCRGQPALSEIFR